MADLLTDETAIVTGGASGIGRGIAIAFARHGADVVVADLTRTNRVPGAAPTLEAIEDETDARGVFVECDVTERDDLVAAVETAEELGGVDVMVNNAGVTGGVEFLEATEEDYDALMDVNLKGVYFGCQVAGEAMVERGEGSIINVSSAAAKRGFPAPGSETYCASKGGVRSLTFGLAGVLGPEVRVNALLPGFIVETGLAVDGGHDEESIRRRAEDTALDRPGYPDDLGGVAVFLASDLAEYVTASEILVDGGMVRTRTA